MQLETDLTGLLCIFSFLDVLGHIFEKSFMNQTLSLKVLLYPAGFFFCRMLLAEAQANLLGLDISGVALIHVLAV